MAVANGEGLFAEANVAAFIKLLTFKLIFVEEDDDDDEDGGVICMREGMVDAVAR